MSKPIDSSSGVVTEYTSSPEVYKKKPADFFQKVFVGSVSGMSAAFLIQPMIYLKNVDQSNAQEVKSSFIQESKK